MGLLIEFRGFEAPSLVLNPPPPLTPNEIKRTQEKRKTHNYKIRCPGKEKEFICHLRASGSNIYICRVKPEVVGFIGIRVLFST
jgi:hypothetical protein